MDTNSPASLPATGASAPATEAAIGCTLSFRRAWVVLLVLLAACSGGGGPAAPTQPPVNTNVITISSSGQVSPVQLVVSPGSRVRFVNNDTRRHEMTSDPHPDHTNCPEINQVGLLTPGQSRETGNLVAIRTCGFHDHEDPDASGLKGRIVVQ